MKRHAASVGVQPSTASVSEQVPLDEAPSDRMRVQQPASAAQGEPVAEPHGMTAPAGPWRLWWQGSGPERGDHIMHGRTRIAYFPAADGTEGSHKAAEQVVYEHNCALEAATAPQPPAPPPAAGREVPEGWQLVPKVQTDEMDVAWREQWYSRRRAIDDADTQDCYAAMLAAAPQSQEVPRG